MPQSLGISALWNLYGRMKKTPDPITHSAHEPLDRCVNTAWMMSSRLSPLFFCLG